MLPTLKSGTSTYVYNTLFIHFRQSIHTLLRSRPVGKRFSKGLAITGEAFCASLGLFGDVQYEYGVVANE